MVNLMIAAAVVSIIFPPNPLDRETGIFSQYAVGVMQPSVEAQQGWQQLPEDVSWVDGFIAVWDCDRIGDVGLLSIKAPEWSSWEGWSDYQTVMVADCSGHWHTTEWMINNNIIAEISGELAQEHDVICLCAIEGEIIWLP